MARVGEFLKKEEVEELEAYREKGIAPPDKYHDAVFESSQIQGSGYRWKTNEEKAAEKAVAKEAEAALERRQALDEKIAKTGLVGANEQTATTLVPSVGEENTAAPAGTAGRGNRP